MARFRLSRPAQVDLAAILATSVERWGPEARSRYAAILTAAMRHVAADPKGALTKARSDLLPGLRSVHTRYVRLDHQSASVKRPVHVLYYRVVKPDLIEIVRVLHERMDPGRHVPTTAEDEA